MVISYWQRDTRTNRHASAYRSCCRSLRCQSCRAAFPSCWTDLLKRTGEKLHATWYKMEVTRGVMAANLETTDPHIRAFCSSHWRLSCHWFRRFNRSKPLPFPCSLNASEPDSECPCTRMTRLPGLLSIIFGERDRLVFQLLLLIALLLSESVHPPQS